MAGTRTRSVKVELLADKAPTIHIPWNVMIDINKIVDSRKDEIGWIGLVDYDSDNNIHTVRKIFVPEQDVDGSTTEISWEGIGKLLADPEFDRKLFRYWGHSHGSMGSVNPSGQDVSQMKSFGEHCERFIGTIHCRDRDVIMGYMIDRTLNLYYEDIEVIVTEHPDVYEKEALIVKLMEEISNIENEIEELKDHFSEKRLSETNWDEIVKKNVKTLVRTSNKTNDFWGKPVPYDPNKIQSKRWDGSKYLYYDVLELPNGEPYQRSSKTSLTKAPIEKEFPNANKGKSTRRSKRRQSKKKLNNLDFDIESESEWFLNAGMNPEEVEKWREFYSDFEH